MGSCREEQINSVPQSPRRIAAKAWSWCPALSTSKPALFSAAFRSHSSSGSVPTEMTFCAGIGRDPLESAREHRNLGFGPLSGAIALDANLGFRALGYSRFRASAPEPAVMQSRSVSCRVTVGSRVPANQQRRTEESEGEFWSGANVNTGCNGPVKPESAAVLVAMAHFRAGAIPRKIRRAVRIAWNAVAGPCTAENGPDGTGTRNIARTQIPRTSRPTLNQTKVTPLVLRQGFAMSIAKAVPNSARHSFLHLLTVAEE